ncbi:BTB/POZ domain and ankyrin repeat-containing protein NPR1 [Macadamia integrifolia]|uniref:BTB/POZ domain and ankyrin repeat-containing protein NPR1 n=1 Tax=Macadamia integrifolia TaxID=60698 RepID=UPI001C5284B2|nr:BTB/POZ domain and ankyrin repeat-containing protein NPR1 [Macadamia integrifolia]XP_042477301.1 BTB/POZ domain and ankyrin repeat-containing protein NPR1 [Macadamia integrifolia]
MMNSTEPSSYLSFASSSHLSNDSSSFNMSASSVPESGASLEVLSLSKLGCNLDQLLADTTFDYSDAEVIVEDITVGVHRCILAARSKFFHDLFVQGNTSSQKEGKPKYYMTDLVPYHKVGYEAFLIFLSYLYTGKLKASPLEVSTCVDGVCAHDSCRPAINFVVELTYASSIFQITELVSLFQRRLMNFVEKAFVEDVIPILLVSFHCQLDQLLTHCVDRVAQSDLESISLEKELPFEITQNLKSLHLKSQSDKENEMVMDTMHEKRIRRIHKALDSDDVELVKLLLSESNITLDAANALHYAAAYCDPKVVSEVLDLGLADVNLRNDRGYTVLHVAAMRKEPSVIVSLLTKGASALEKTLDGQSAVSICRRMTRPKDYGAKTKQGQETNKDRICIDVLEREMWRNPLAVDMSMSSPNMADDLHAWLLYLENRVAFARLFFPTEAKLAMDIAHADTTSEFIGISASERCGNLREVDLNETPTMQKKRLHSRLEALNKTVEMGRRYFPHCSQVLDKFLEEDLPDLFYLEKGTPDEQRIKRARFTELKDDVQKAFNKDKAKNSRSGLSSSSSSSTSLKGCVNKKVTKK